MTIGLILTVLFVVLQVIDVIDWAWWQIALPLFIEIGVSIVAFIAWVLFIGKLAR